jgi:adenosine kinase
MDGVILGIENPIMDISAGVDGAVMTKYGLKPADAILVEDGDEKMKLFDELTAKPDVEYIAGGAAQNSIRVAQWMLQAPGATTYIGCVGKDATAAKMRECCKKDGVNAAYMECDKPTGKCAVCITGVERSLMAYLSAANEYKVDHLKANMALLDKAKIVYSSGFFTTVSPDSLALLGPKCLEGGKTFCFNLSAPFIMQVPPFKACLMATLPYVDYLFGNETEALTFAETEGWPEKDIVAIAKKMAALPKQGSKPRTVVITQGKDPTVVVVNGQVSEHPIIALPKEKLKDTNGAGDSYVGGFLAGLALEMPIESCHKAAAYAASVIVQTSGCQFPPGAPMFKFWGSENMIGANF